MENFINVLFVMLALGLSLGITYGVLVLLVPTILNIFKKSTK